jgi:phage terminase large subunit-like protein
VTISREDLIRYSRDPVAFIDRFITKTDRGEPFVLAAHQREILRTMFAFDADGRLSWDTGIYSSVKKDGKTTTNACVTLWWAFTQEAPNELKLVANDLEQSVSRAFTTMKGLLRHNRELGAGAEVKATSIALANGTVIQALANDYASEAGANQGWSSWTELWAFTSESARRMWEELTPVPTRRNSIRFVDTYAGFEGESELLFALYKSVVDAEEHPEGQGVRIHPTLPIFMNREARVCAYWDHEPRMPWQTETYRAAQRRTLRPNTYLRLHENRWTTGVSSFIDAALWDANVDASYRPGLATSKLYVGIDAGLKSDHSAVVGVRWRGERLELACHRIWRPAPGMPLSLEHTIEAFVRTLHSQRALRRVVVDPWQMARSVATLREAGVPIEELPQTQANQTAFTSALFDVLQGRTLRLYPAPDLREQALRAVAVETPRGLRLAKEKASAKIDAAVALAMAVYAAVQGGQEKLVMAAASVSPAEAGGIPAWQLRHFRR